MGPFILAWMVGEGIIIYRSTHQLKNTKVFDQFSPEGRPAAVYPPGPGQLLIASGVFVMLALLAEAPKARTLATLLAWGFDIAAFMNIGGFTDVNAQGVWPPQPASPYLIFPRVVQLGPSDSGTNSGTHTTPPGTTGPVPKPV